MTHLVTAKDVPELRADLIEDGNRFIDHLNKKPRLTPDEMRRLAEMKKWVPGLRVSDLTWVSTELRTLAEVAAQSLMPLTMDPEYLPSPNGLLVWDGVLNGLAGVSWQQRGSKVMLSGLVPKRNAQARIREFHEKNPERAKQFADDIEQQRAQLLPDNEQPVPLGVELTPLNIYAMTKPQDEMDMVVLAFLPPMVMALWLLMGQTLTTKEMVRPSRHGMKRLARLDAALLMETRYVTLRRRSVNPTVGESTGYHVSYRSAVRGYWKDQRHGPALSKTRRIWVDPYIRGPEGAPLLDPDKLVGKLIK